jgi:hypothetical protein
MVVHLQFVGAVAVKYTTEQYIKAYLAVDKAICTLIEQQYAEMKYDMPCKSYESNIKKGLFLKFALENIACNEDTDQDKLISIANRFSKNCGDCVISDAEIAAFVGTPEGLEIIDNFDDLDVDVKKFVAANKTKSLLEIDELDKLVKAIKAAGLWSKFHAIYPFVGADLGAKTYNLVNIAKHQIGWGSGSSSVAKGVDFDGTTNGFGDLNLNFASLGYSQIVDVHVSFYTPDANTIARNIAWGAIQDYTVPGGDDRMTFVFDGVGLNYFTDMWAQGGLAGRVVVYNYLDAGNQGYYITTTKAQNDLRVRREGVQLGAYTSNRVVSPVPNLDLYMGAINVDNTTQDGTTRSFGFFTVGYGLTDAECDTISTIVKTFLNSLGR